MNVSLTPELEAFVNEKVASGMYYSASEVIREGLRLLKEQDTLRQMRLEELKKEIAIGIEQADRGQFVDGEEVFKALKEKSSKRRQSKAQ
ncbi:type II toxin-antitoxin system ParD family antitoxin [Cyanosarcina cf. burmensis CCALA 770]|nr:type II toxin-antitoxin system ParD family antitoxin [Cyanosarcina cf. burmensis CCALA 770]